MSNAQVLGTKGERDMRSAIDHYSRLFKISEPLEKVKQAAEASKNYYTLATDFYLQGWGKLFHFGARKKGETLLQSQLRYERELAQSIGLSEGDKCLDIGCGVGGPMMNMAKTTGALITGINNCTYQIEKGKKFVKEEGLENQCSFLECDWMNMPLPSNSFDKAYAIEATCHAAEKRDQLFGEIYRLLKPGAFFGGYEWVMTDKFDPSEPEHLYIKHQIEIGDGITNLNFASDVTQALAKAGFEVMECRDKALECDPETPWYLPLKGEGISFTKLRVSPIGRKVMHQLLRVSEAAHLVPQGTVAVHNVLETAADGLVAGGEKGIFTPMLFFLARKQGI